MHHIGRVWMVGNPDIDVAAPIRLCALSVAGS